MSATPAGRTGPGSLLRRRLGGVVAVVAVLAACAAPAPPVASGSEAVGYRNPVFEPILADPSVVRADDGTFYAYGTEDDWGDGEGSRVVPVVRSTDLVTWEYVGAAFADQPRWHNGFVWAPDVVRVGGAYHLYYSLSVWGDANPGIGVATSPDPAGPFTDHGALLTSREVGVENSIDPQVVVDDGARYLLWGSFHGIYGVRLSADGLSLAGNKFQIAGDGFEAPYVVVRDGVYWFFGSLGSCCEGALSTYRVAVGRAERLQGPYLGRDGTDLREGLGTPLLRSGAGFVGPGHPAVVRDDHGGDWLLYHAIEPRQPYVDSGANRRVLMLDPLVWTDGWPSVAGGQPGDGRQPPPRLDPRPLSRPAFEVHE